ncbi:MAG TPA: hypothetical protein VGC42_19275 [Kofleriaceae bacterium]
MRTSILGALWLAAMTAGTAGCAADATTGLDESSDSLRTCPIDPSALDDDGTAPSDGAGQACTLYCYTGCILPSRRSRHAYPSEGPVTTGCPTGQICTIDTPKTCAGTGSPGSGEADEGDSSPGHCVTSP